MLTSYGIWPRDKDFVDIGLNVSTFSFHIAINKCAPAIIRVCKAILYINL